MHERYRRVVSRVGAFSLGLWWGSSVAAATIQPCSPTVLVGTVCTVRLADLRPTQFGVGLLEVEQTKRELAGKSAAAVQRVILKKKIAIVIGPHGEYWLVDRHHLTRALWDMDVREAAAYVVGRIEDRQDFWQVMRDAHWAWLFDERGRALDPTQLPANVADLPDFPYRSLAGFAEDLSFFDKPGNGYFIEFAWAKYFGEQLDWAPVNERNLEQRVEEARHLACLPAAASLPGYPGRVCKKRPR